MLPTAEPEREHEQWIRRIAQIDRLLESTVPTLIRVAEWSRKKGLPSIPLYVASDSVSPSRKYILVHAICASTIQRLHSVQRRFRLAKHEREVLKGLADSMPRTLMADESANRKELPFLMQLGSDLFGAVNPLTSSEVFWSFIRAGERFAHSSVGFLAFFGILWALGRRHPNKNEAGAALEPSGPTATITAKCLIAIYSLCEALRQRGEHYHRASKQIAELEAVAGDRGAQATWKFAFTLDRLAGTLFELSPYTIVSEDFVRVGEFLLEKTKSLGPESDTSAVWQDARERIKALLQKLDAEQKLVFADSKLVVTSLLPQVVARLEPGGAHEELRKDFCIKLLQEGPPAYWQDHADAARRAQNLCSDSLDALQLPFHNFAKLDSTDPPTATLLKELLDALWKSNDGVAAAIDRFVVEPVEWCRRIIDEETARASAGNLTDFDPAGLISAITVAQKWRLISRPTAEDAIGHALTGALRDGSWMRGQPMFLEARVLGIWPHTPDIAWILATAVNSGATITVADEKLLAFVDWLERTRTQFESKDLGKTVRGWSSELDRLPHIIDLWNTSVSINALLEIRELIEMRFWQICTRRFTILRSRRLQDVAPVDLGAAHGKRLHRSLMRMARLTELPETYQKQDYAIVLHGPPGSSKTAIVEGLGAEMWKGANARTRIIRITPSDFTRQGEARLDFEARFIFELLSHVRGVTILFDEIDDFLRQRMGDGKPSFIQLITPAMLNRLQDLRDAAPRQEICFVIATNFIDKIEPALLRPGRIDSVIALAYPDAWSRQAILEEHLKDASAIPPALMELILEKTVGWPWATYNKLTEEIAKHAAGLTDTSLKEEINRFADRIQSSDYYYRDSNRWEKYSPPLGNEFVHLSFCRSKNLAKCRQMVTDVVTDLEEKLRVRLPLEDAFDRQVAAEERR